MFSEAGNYCEVSRASITVLVSKKTDNVLTIEALRGNIVAVEKKYDIFELCVCSHKCLACDVRASYCYVSPVRLYIFSKLSPKRLSRMKVIGHKMFVRKKFLFYEEFSDIQGDQKVSVHLTSVL